MIPPNYLHRFLYFTHFLVWRVSEKMGALPEFWELGAPAHTENLVLAMHTFLCAPTRYLSTEFLRTIIFKWNSNCVLRSYYTTSQCNINSYIRNKYTVVLTLFWQNKILGLLSCESVTDMSANTRNHSTSHFSGTSKIGRLSANTRP